MFRRYLSVITLALISLSLCGFATLGPSTITGFWHYVMSANDVANGGVRYATVDATAGGSPTQFAMTTRDVTEGPDACGTYNNHVVGIGHNLSALNVRQNTSFAAGLLGFESNFCVSGRNSLEFYLRYVDTTGTTKHVLEATGAHDGTFSDFGMYGDIINFYNSDNAQLWKMNTTATPWESLYFGRTNTEPHTISSTANGCPWIRQRNSADNAYYAYPCMRDVNGGTAGGEEFYYSNGGNLPWYSLANPQSGATWANHAFAFQSSSLSSGQNIIGIQGPGTAVNMRPLFMQGGNASNDWEVLLENSGGGNAFLNIQVDSASGGDAYTRVYNLSTFWSYGLDNSDLDAFVISQGPTPGSNNRIRIATDGVVTHNAIVFASLGTPSNGSVAYCSDCTFANPCAGGGTGAIAKRLNGAWRCD